MMIPTTLERSIASLVFIAAFAALVKLAAYIRQRSVRNQSSVLPAGMRTDQPTLLYFWSAGCSQCRPQERQIEEAKAQLQKAGKPFTVLKVNALEDETLARSMRVVTVPTTVFIDPRGKIASWNPGLTPWRTIVDQYQTIG